MADEKHESARLHTPAGMFNGAICNKKDLEEFLDSGGSPNSWAAGLYAGSTLLQAAIQYDDLEIVKLLLSRGADKTIRDDLGRTAKQVAEACKASAEIKALL